VLAFNGSVLMFLCLYAFINAVAVFWRADANWSWTGAGLRRRRVHVTFGMYFYERRENRRVRSNLLRLDARVG